MSGTYYLAKGVRKVFATRGPRRHFFGYYDKSPLDAAGQRLLCHAVDFDGRMVDGEDQAEIGYWDLASGDYHRLGRTRAFNWQQGSMLQWLGPGFDRSVVYNDRRGDHFAAIVLDVDSGRTHELATTVYSVDPKGRYAVTPSFERHALCRPGYCYSGIMDERWRGDCPEADGVFHVDLESGESHRILSVRELMTRQPLDSMQYGAHYVEHMLVDPSGERFAFLHRWLTHDGGIYARCYVCDPTGEHLEMLPDGGMYSHGNWMSERDFIIYGRKAGSFSKMRYSTGALGRLAQPVLQTFRRVMHLGAARWVHRQVTPDAFLRFGADSSVTALTGDDVPAEDGHMSFRPGDNSWMLIDSYPDVDCRQHLMVYHVDQKRRVSLGWFRTLDEQQATGYRCDLHPRWSRCGNFVAIDSLHEGNRQIYLLDVREALESAA